MNDELYSTVTAAITCKADIRALLDSGLDWYACPAQADLAG
jgi:hypothetical protein